MSSPIIYLVIRYCFSPASSGSTSFSLTLRDFSCNLRELAKSFIRTSPYISYISLFYSRSFLSVFLQISPFHSTNCNMFLVSTEFSHPNISCFTTKAYIQSDEISKSLFGFCILLKYSAYTLPFAMLKSTSFTSLHLLCNRTPKYITYHFFRFQEFFSSYRFFEILSCFFFVCF